MRKTIALLLLLISSVYVNAQTGSRKNFNTDNGLAIKGYDPVTYFTLNKAVEGKKEISVLIEGATYRFSSEANKKLFAENPSKYEPQYGGWCAYAMGAEGEKVEIDPETYKIKDNKLYLFYNAYFINTLPKWNKDENNLKVKADANWIKLNK